MPRTLLAKGADVLVTMDARGARSADGGVYVEDNVIVAVGTAADLPATADVVIDLPGTSCCRASSTRITTCSRASPARCPRRRTPSSSTGSTALYPVWARLTPEMIQRVDADRDGGAPAVRLHDDVGSPLPLSRTGAVSTTRSRPHARWACASTRRAAA